ncbi:MAG: LysE family translocator [Stappiaceae bacterium]
MIDQATLFTYIAILFGFVLIPGPAVLLTLARASSSGTRVGIATSLGIAVGDIIHTLMAVLGISAIILASAFMFSLIKYIGAGYLIYLGIRALLERTPELNETQAIKLSPRQAFRQATLAEVLNPKSALFFLAFLPQFVQPENGAVALQLTTLGLLFVLIGLLSTVGFALAGGGVGRFLRKNPKILKLQGKVVGCIYCGVGIRLALQEK